MRPDRGLVGRFFVQAGSAGPEYGQAGATFANSRTRFGGASRTTRSMPS